MQLARDGRIHFLATSDGDILELDGLARKRLRLIGVTFRTRSRLEHAAVVRAYEPDVMPAFTRGAIRQVVDRVLGLDEAAEVQDYM